MNNKISLHDLKCIIRDTPAELKGRVLKEVVDYREMEKVGWYQKSKANWLYFIYAIQYNDKYKDIIFVATVGDIIQ